LDVGGDGAGLEVGVGIPNFNGGADRSWVGGFDVPFVEVAGEERELAKFNGRRRSMDDRVEGTYVPAILPG